MNDPFFSFPKMRVLAMAAWLFLSYVLALVVGMENGMYPRWYRDQSCPWRVFTVFLLVWWLAIPVALVCGV